MLHAVLPLPVPASVYGLVLLLAALTAGVVKLEQVKETVTYLTCIFPLLFVPAAAGIMAVLSRHGFVSAQRGRGGGYRLTRSPDQYTVSEILMLTEGSLAPVSCLTPGASACARMANCRTYEMWKGLNDLISDYFGKITLADLALPDQAGNDYVI